MGCYLSQDDESKTVITDAERWRAMMLFPVHCTDIEPAVLLSARGISIYLLAKELRAVYVGKAEIVKKIRSQEDRSHTLSTETRSMGRRDNRRSS